MDGQKTMSESEDTRSNKPDAANPAMTLWLTIEDQWRRVADLGRSATPCLRRGMSHRMLEAL
jgi:hypothetical protein